MSLPDRRRRKRRRARGIHRLHPWIECACRKITYRTREEADLAAAIRSERDGVTLRSYRCTISGSFHVTHEEPRNG